MGFSLAMATALAMEISDGRLPMRESARRYSTKPGKEGSTASQRFRTAGRCRPRSLAGAQMAPASTFAVNEVFAFNEFTIMLLKLFIL
jgi:hypothetical protein